MVLPSLKQVCRLSESLFNKLAVARGKPTIIVSKTQQLGSIHSKQDCALLQVDSFSRQDETLSLQKR